MLTHLLLASITATQPTPQAELVGFAVLPADTFRDGPTSGQFIEAKNGRTPPFVDKQPVQGISSLVPTDEPGTYFALSDNGFGAKANSADYVLCVYKVTPDFETGAVAWELAFELNDADNGLDWPIVAEMQTYPGTDIAVPGSLRDGRKLTGADFDVESMVRLPDGTFWMGVEFGPFLLHFSADGTLLEPPVELPGEGMHSPDHPTKDPATAKIARSSGFEGLGLNINGGGHRLTPVLEKPLPDDGNNLRLYIFSPRGQRRTPDGAWGSNWFRVEVSTKSDAIGEVVNVFWPSSARLNPLVLIERDDEEGEGVRHKALTLSTLADEEWKRLEIADLLNLADPNDLDGDGSTTFRFPFFTIESVVVVDERTVLICNDNNYPLSNGRSATEPDHTEFILVRLPQPLAEMGRE